MRHNNFMAKRLTDTEKWDDPWFYFLNVEEQWLWIYLLDRCDHAGIWKVNWSYFELKWGHKPNLEKFKDRIFQISNERIFIPKFLIFQYGSNWTKSKVKAHYSAIKILKNLKILEQAKTLTNGNTGSKTINKIEGLLILKKNNNIDKNQTVTNP